MQTVKNVLDILETECNVVISRAALIKHINNYLEETTDYKLMNQYIIKDSGKEKIIKYYKEHYPNGKT